jgi:peptide/nickel transport system substrate-binding protein
MRRLNRYRVASFLAAVALVLLALLGLPEAQGGAADEDRIVLALERDQNNMDPFLHFQRVGILMNINMYDSLLHKTPKLQYEPSLATESRALDDTTWEFKLRQGVKFHYLNPQVRIS